MALLGNRVLDIIKLKYHHIGWVAPNAVTGIFVRERNGSFIHRDLTEDPDGGRDWKDIATCQGTPTAS